MLRLSEHLSGRDRSWRQGRPPPTAIPRFTVGTHCAQTTGNISTWGCQQSTEQSPRTASGKRPAALLLLAGGAMINTVPGIGPMLLTGRVSNLDYVEPEPLVPLLAIPRRRRGARAEHRWDDESRYPILQQASEARYPHAGMRHNACMRARCERNYRWKGSEAGPDCCSWGCW